MFHRWSGGKIDPQPLAAMSVNSESMIAQDLPFLHLLRTVNAALFIKTEVNFSIQTLMTRNAYCLPFTGVGEILLHERLIITITGTKYGLYLITEFIVGC